MTLGIFAKTFPGTNPLSVLSAARDAGYQAVQYNMACSGLSSLPLVISDEHALAVRQASGKTGVAIAAVSATYNMIHPDPTQRAKGRQSFVAIASAAPTMGTRLITLCTGSYDARDQWKFHPDNATPAAWDDLCAEFRFLLPIAEKYNVLLGVEPELANVVSSASHARQLLDTLGNSRIRIVFDPANLFEVATLKQQRFLIEQFADLLGDSIVLAHAKDRLADGRFTTAGTGILDYRTYLAALCKIRFNGTLVTHGLSANEARTVAHFLVGSIT